MKAKVTSRPVVEEAQHEHHECMKAVGELEQCLDSHLDRGPQWIGAVLEVLPRLGRSLREHFEREQDGVLFRKVPLSHPQYAQRLARLEREHAEILEAIEALAAKASQADDDRLYELRAVNAQAQLLVATLRRHEAEETEILIGAHWEEIGAGD